MTLTEKAENKETRLEENLDKKKPKGWILNANQVEDQRREDDYKWNSQERGEEGTG